MDPLLGAVLGWLVPVVVVFGVAAIAIAAIAWAIRAARRSPRARARAEAARADAGSALVRLDDEVGELDLEVSLSGALYGGDAPPSLRRARRTAQHVRDQAFEEFQAISDETLAPSETERRARLIRARVDQALGIIAGARADHRQWTDENVSAATQVDAARRRLAVLRESMGDPQALVRELADRFDDSEWADAATAARTALADAAEAEALLDRAGADAADPSRSALADLAMAERRIRSGQSEAQRLEEAHRLISQAAQALTGEFDAARAAVRQAMVTREGLEPVDAERLGTAIREVTSALDALQPDAGRRPTAAVDRIARLRDRLDLALGDARTAQQRLRGARTALPGTLAAARNAIAHAEAVVSGSPGAAPRVRLAAAQDELAAARQAADPVEALDAARRAMRHAEDAQALAAYARMTRE
ncbi:MAG: hypothetical protein J0I62_19545 [Microbacterium sp.]|nr:hypothetical protein [Microbacterium sp.]